MFIVTLVLLKLPKLEDQLKLFIYTNRPNAMNSSVLSDGPRNGKTTCAYQLARLLCVWWFTRSWYSNRSTSVLYTSCFYIFFSHQMQPFYTKIWSTNNQILVLTEKIYIKITMQCGQMYDTVKRPLKYSILKPRLSCLVPSYFLPG